MLTSKNLMLSGLALAALLVGSPPAEAFWGHHRRVTSYAAMPSVPVAVGYAPVVVASPVVVARPIVVGSPVVTAGYAPAMSYAAPVTTYYAPAPVTSFYAPAPVTSFYAPAPVTTFYAPPAAAGVVVQRPVYVWP